MSGELGHSETGTEAPAAAGRELRRDTELPTAIAAISRLAYARAKKAGVPLDPLLERAHLTAEQIEDVRTRIKVRTQIEFLNAVSEALEDDYLGFHLAQMPDLREMGLFYYVLASSDRLIDALRRIARYGTVVNEGVSPHCVDGENVGLMLRYVGVSRHLDKHQIEYWVTAIVRTCRALTGLQLVPKHVRLIHRREERSPELATFFSNEIEFGAIADEITFAKQVRDLPLVNADPYLNELMTGYCEDALSSRQSSRGSFRSSVENTIAPLLPHGEVEAGEIARRLGVSQRTFARRLSAEGLTFSGLLESLRSALASRYLKNEKLAISEIAWLLGYREVSTFSHAFKRWTGKSPRESRGHH